MKSLDIDCPCNSTEVLHIGDYASQLKAVSISLRVAFLYFMVQQSLPGKILFDVAAAAAVVAVILDVYTKYCTTKSDCLLLEQIRSSISGTSTRTSLTCKAQYM